MGLANGIENQHGGENGQTLDRRRAQIARMSQVFQTLNEEYHHEGPQALPPEIDDSIFKSRLSVIWTALMIKRKTPKWDEDIKSHTDQEWQHLIDKFTYKNFKPILVFPQPPTIKRLNSLQQVDTDNAGVYAWMLGAQSDSFLLNNECRLEVASASSYSGGLNKRKGKLVVPWTDPHGKLMSTIRRFDLDRQGLF